jgi:hypothetical protein
MKIISRIIFLSLVVISMMLSQCRTDGRQNAAGLESGDTGTAKIVFMEYEHDFGKVSEGEKAGYIFKFENQGTSNLVIASATTSCGCTVPEYDAKPIAPGGSGNLEVVFDTSGRNGKQTKTITVKSNARTPVVLLKITAEVVAGNR